MNDMLNSLEGFDSGSNYKFGDKMERSKNPRSLFDLSHLNSLTINNAGLLIPIALWETLPSDDFDINVDALLRVMPQVVPLYSRQRMYVYGFYSRYSDLWNNWQVFMDKGYTGNVSKAIPTLHKTDSSVNVDYTNANIIPDSLADYIGLPIGAAHSNLFDNVNNTTIANISALPFMMYLRIYRDYFMNKNEWINDRVMLPDDDSRFRLNDNGELLSAKDESKSLEFALDQFDISYASNIYKVGLLYHDYPDDYFTSALPFTQRGNTPVMSKIGNVNFNSIYPGTGSYSNAFLLGINDVSQLGLIRSSDLGAAPFNNDSSTGLISDAKDLNDGTVTPLSLGNTSGQANIVKNALNNNSINIQITLEDIRKLAIEQIELEQLARTDGSYRQFGLSFFGETSRAAYDFRPTYIGGTYKNIAFTEVLQTSGSSIPTADPTASSSPLGAYAGHGITGIQRGRIGHIHCDDYGMIMLLACIMPDVYYSQGLDKIFTDSLQSEKFMPERVKLGMQPIYNKEIYYAGNNGSSSGDDNYLWAYQNPFDHLRYMPNRIHGKIADINNKSFYPYTQSRKFTQLPNWGRSFSEANNVRKDYLFAPLEDAYSAQFSINVRAVRPLPYKAIPAQIIN